MRILQPRERVQAKRGIHTSDDEGGDDYASLPINPPTTGNVRDQIRANPRLIQIK
jgi:hypothetical protein